jgi:hypothetical protein
MLATVVLMAALKWADAVPAYPDARQLCSEHVTGNGMHIIWQSWAVHDPVEKVTAFYTKALAAAGEEETGGARSWHAPQDADVVVTVAAGNNEHVPSCAEKPKANEPTMIVVSRAIHGK